VDGSDSTSYPATGSVVINVESPGSTTRELSRNSTVDSYNYSHHITQHTGMSYFFVYRYFINTHNIGNCFIWEVKKVTLSLWLTMYHAMNTYWGSGCIAPFILDFGTRWRWMVSFRPRPFYSQGKRLGGPQNRSERDGEEKNSQLPPGIES
jgi:hypothetical protein